MLQFSLNTFIKICLLDTGKKIPEIQKKLGDEGGYDFYNSFQRATRAKLGGKSSEEAKALISSLSNETERKYNSALFEQVQKKFGSIRSIEPVKSKKKLSFKNHQLEIVVDPLFMFEKSGVRKVVSVWGTKSPELSQRYAAVACFIMRETYKNTALANAVFHFYDGLQDKTYSEKQIGNNTSLVLNSDVRTIANLAKEI